MYCCPLGICIMGIMWAIEAAAMCPMGAMCVMGMPPPMPPIDMAVMATAGVDGVVDDTWNVEGRRYVTRSGCTKVSRPFVEIDKTKGSTLEFQLHEQPCWAFR